MPLGDIFNKILDRGVDFGFEYAERELMDDDAEREQERRRSIGGTGPLTYYGFGNAPLAGPLGMIFGVKVKDADGNESLNVIALLVYGVILAGLGFVAWRMFKR